MLILFIVFILSSIFPTFSNKGAVKIRNFKDTATAYIDSIQLFHEITQTKASVKFFYHFTPNGKDTVLLGSTKEEFYNVFTHSAAKLKAKYKAGDTVTVYYKITDKGRYRYNIYPDNSFFSWNKSFLAGFIEFFAGLFIICTLIVFIRYKERKDILYTGLGYTVVIFSICCFTYASSPYINQQLFKQTHPGFTEIKADVYDWNVKHKRQRRNSYHYITANFSYNINGKNYKSTIVPVKVRSLFNARKIAHKRLERLKTSYNTTAFVDPQNPEYAVLYANNNKVFLFSTPLFSFLGIILIFLFIVMVVLILKPKKQISKESSKFK